jgi:hypothetical protein
MSTLDAELDRLAAVNDIPRDEIDTWVHEARANSWRLASKVESDDAILDALRLGIAADMATREANDARDNVPARLAFADVGADAVALPRRGLRRAVRRLLNVGAAGK